MGTSIENTWAVSAPAPKPSDSFGSAPAEAKAVAEAAVMRLGEGEQYEFKNVRLKEARKLDLQHADAANGI
jgi:hypothetical protein